MASRKPRAWKRPGTVPSSTRSGLVFLDETGSIAKDRFFGVGCLKIEEASPLLRAMQKLRDTNSFYISHGKEFHFTAVTGGTLAIYKEALKLVHKSGARFSCFIADRTVHDPVARFGTPYRAYEKLAAQLLLGTIKPKEIVTVLADNYSTPDTVHFEIDVRSEVNHRLGRRLAVAHIVRLDSRSTDGLQLVDLLLGAVAFEYRQAAGLASGKEKSELSDFVKGLYGVSDFQPGSKAPPELNVRVYGP